MNQPIITIKTLSKDQIEAACALLYDSYIKDIEWEFTPDNPSQIRVEERGDSKILLDRFTERAIWFGAFDCKKLIGCTRLHGVDENNKLEIEGYQSSHVINKFLSDAKKNSYMELTKAAVDKNYFGKNILSKLFLAAFKYCEQNHYSVIACTHNGYIKSLFKRIGCPLILESAFKYEPQDQLPVNFYLADYSKSEISQIISTLENLLTNSKRNSVDILKALEMVAPILPTPVYWHDKNGIVLGINEHCLKAIGTSKEIIGKTPYEFYSKEVAECILSHNEQVMRSEEVLAQEERINDITTGQTKYFSSIKAPLYDEGGNIFGVVGTSVDITAEKETARLKIEHEAHQAEKIVQQKFKKFIDDVMHLIQCYKLETLNDKLGIEFLEMKHTMEINLNKREKEILYFLSLNKSISEIAEILTVLDNKQMHATTVQSMVNEKLYPKFKAGNINQLLQNAIKYRMIPSLMPEVE